MNGPKEKNKGVPSINVIYLIIGLTIFGLLVTNVSIYFNWLRPFADSMKQSALDYLLSGAKRAAEMIERSMDVELAGIGQLSQDISLGDNPDFLTGRFLKENPSVQSLSIISLEGAETRFYSRSKYIPESSFQNYRLATGFEGARQGKTFLGPVAFTDKAESFMEIFVPIRRSEVEAPIAILKASFYLRGIWEKIPDIKVGQTGRVSVIDDQGMLIADLNPSRVLKKVDLSQLPSVRAIMGGALFWEAKNQNEEGKEVIGASVPIGNYRWSVLLEQDVSEAEAPIIKINWLMEIFYLIQLIVIGILLLLLVSLRRADRILIERYDALEINRQKLEEAKSVLEIKVKARTRELEELAEGLEQQVKERTKELTKRMRDLERFYKLAVGREMKMIELKKEIEQLKAGIAKSQPVILNQKD